MPLLDAFNMGLKISKNNEQLEIDKTRYINYLQEYIKLINEYYNLPYVTHKIYLYALYKLYLLNRKYNF